MIKLNKEDFKNWRSEKWIDYISIPITFGEEIKRLRLRVNLVGDIKIFLGNKELYSGTNVCEAIIVFNDNR